MNGNRQLLEEQLAVLTDPKERIDLENHIAFGMRDSDARNSIEKSHQVLELANSLTPPYLKGIADAHYNIGTKHTLTGNPDIGLPHLHKAEEIYIELNDPLGMARVNILKSNYFWNRGEVNSAMELIFSGLKLVETYDDPVTHGFGHYFLGTFYSDMFELDNSLRHLAQARDYFEQANHSEGVARSHNSTTLAYRRKEEFDKALHHGKISLEIYKISGNPIGLARSLNDLGTLLVDTGDVDNGIEMLFESLEIRKNVSSKQAVITTLTELGLAYYKKGDKYNAIDFLNQARTLTTEINSRVKLVRILKALSKIEKDENRFESALALLEEAYQVESQQIRSDAETRVKNIETRLEAEKRISEAEIERLKTIELKRAYDQIEEKSQNITDSIRYAKNIQSAILPGNELFPDCEVDSFVFFSPRDIVSGDFYWARRKDNVAQVAVIDCTGHGVPGALMSMLGFSLINQNIDSVPIEKPGLILDLLREGIVNALKQDQTNGTSDGMDVSFINLDLEKGQLYFAGANRPAIIVDPNNGTAREIKGDKFPAGIHPSFSDHDFAHHSIPFSKGEILYLFTDGYPDQFGGPRGKKFMYKHFRDLLFEISHLPLNEQKQILEEKFFSWKGDLEQVDDVTVVGIKL